MGCKRKPKNTIQSWTSPFRYDNIEHHMRTQHPSQWDQYSKLVTEEEQEHFLGSVAEPFRNTLLAHFEFGSQGERDLVFNINADIVEHLIGDLLYSPDSDGERDDGDGDESATSGGDDELLAFNHNRRSNAVRSKEIALSLFQRQDVAEDEERKCYTATVVRGKVKLFVLIVRYISCGASFRLVSSIIRQTYEVLATPCLRTCTAAVVSKYVRLVCAVNLQRITELLKQSWTFSIAMDGATHQSSSYLDVRIRMFIPRICNIVNVHVVALPMTERHTGSAMYSILSSMLNVICAEWRDKLLGVSTDGARNMTGRNAGLVTRMAASLSPPNELIRVWCGAHQLDLVMEHILNTVIAERFFVATTTFISYLSRQQNLIADMNTTCPRIVNRWLSTDKVFGWFKRHRPQLLQHINEKHPTSAPPMIWWVYLLAMECFTSHSAKTFRKIQGLTTMISQQQAELDLLVSSYVEEIGAIGPLSESTVSGLDPALHVTAGCYAVPLSKVEEFVLGQASWVEDTLNRASEKDRRDLLVDVGLVFVVACEKIAEICVQRDSANGPITSDCLPPVLPHELVKTTAADFIRMVRRQSYRLERRYNVEHIDVIADQHKGLSRAYRRDEVLRAGIDACDARTPFDVAWKLLAPQYPDLVEYCGGLATVFPGTATVESDFSILRWEKDIFRKSLSHFGLEGVMHSKQYFLLESLFS